MATKSAKKLENSKEQLTPRAALRGSLLRLHEVLADPDYDETALLTMVKETQGKAGKVIGDLMDRAKIRAAGGTIEKYP